uniref:NYN domain-containing protein n=1 Tax=Noccaea caerulescens TaxID=107243 RepID=A0A1J3I8A6_NOCCA
MAGEDEYMSTSPVETVMPDLSVEPINPECIGVFWDVVDFPFPEGLSPDMIYHKMRLFLRSLGRCSVDMSIMAYVDREKFDDKLVGAYKDAGFDIIPREADKHSRYRSMSLDIAMWEVDMRYEGICRKSLMVLSKEIEKESLFFTFLESMICVCRHIFSTIDHETDSRIERICFSLPLETTLLDSSDRKRKSREESLYYSRETKSDSPVQSTPYECSTHVFWDGFDFPLPYNDPHYAYMLSQSTLKELDLPAASSLVAYINKADLSGGTETETETDGITIIPCQGDKEARSHAMLVDIVLWAMENPATYFEQKSLMVVSKTITQETDFVNALDALHERHYNVILGGPSDPQDLSSPMYTQVLTCDPNPFVREEVVGFSNGLASLFHPEFFKSDILIFWDVRGIPTDFSSVEQVLHNKGYHGKVIIRPYGDMDYGDDFDETPERVRFKSRIIVVSEEDDKYAKVTRMLLDIIFWAMNCDDMPQNLMLISKPFEDTTKCDLVMKAMERRGINIIFRPSDLVASVDKSTVGIFASLCKSVPADVEMHFNESIKSQGRILTEQSDKLASKGVVVFWLAEYCPFNPDKIWYNVQLALKKKGYGGIVSTFTVFIDKRCYSDDEMRQVYGKAGVYDIAISEEDKCGKVTRMLMEMISWRRGLREPANFVVISEPFIDPICDRVVQGLKLRGFNVLFELPDYMLTFGRSRWRWSAHGILGDVF